MLIVMQSHASEAEVRAVCDRIESLGLKAHPIPGAGRTAIGITGNDGAIDLGVLESMPGVIECIRGCHVFPDAVVAGRGEEPHWLYTVVFDGRELWGEASDPTLKVSVEAWEPYLDPA